MWQDMPELSSSREIDTALKQRDGGTRFVMLQVDNAEAQGRVCDRQLI